MSESKTLTDEQSEVTKNQLYRETNKGESYKVWLENSKKPNGLFDQLKSQGKTILENRTEPKSTAAPAPDSDKEFKILGMKLWVAIPVFAVATAGLVYLGVKLFSKKKTAPAA